MAVLNTTLEDAVDLIGREFEESKLDPFDNVMKISGLVKVKTYIKDGNTKRHKERPISSLYASDKSEGGIISKTLVQQGYYKDTFSKAYSESIDITIEMRELDKLKDVYDSASFLSGVCQRREDLNLSMFLSFGSSTSYLNKDGRTIDISTGDGLSIFHNTHTLTGSTKTFSNIVPNNPAFSESALDLGANMFVTNILTNLGEQVPGKPKILWSTDNETLVNGITRLLKATAQISAPNANVPNVYLSRYTHKILNKIDMNANGFKDLDKRNMWGLCDERITSFYHDVFMTPQMRYPSIGNNGEDINTLNWTFTAIDMHDSCVVSPRGLVRSLGDGSST